MLFCCDEYMKNSTLEEIMEEHNKLVSFSYFTKHLGWGNFPFYYFYEPSMTKGHRDSPVFTKFIREHADLYQKISKEIEPIIDRFRGGEFELGKNENLQTLFRNMYEAYKIMHGYLALGEVEGDKTEGYLNIPGTLGI